MPINIDDIETIIKEMLKKDLLINPGTICSYMGIDPIVILPRSPTGEWVGSINNGKMIYNYLQTLRERRIKYRSNYKEAFDSYREGYENASRYDYDIGKMVYYKDIMSYKEFINMRVPEDGIFLIPKSDGSGAYIIPNREEERQWGKKHISGAIKTIKTRVVKGVEAGYIEDTKKTRKFIEGFDPGKYLTYRKPKE